MRLAPLVCGALVAGVSISSAQSQGPIALKRVAPVFPRESLRRGDEGVVRALHGHGASVVRMIPLPGAPQGAAGRCVWANPTVVVD
jgi:hypothetical protein